MLWLILIASATVLATGVGAVIAWTTPAGGVFGSGFPALVVGLAVWAYLLALIGAGAIGTWLWHLFIG